MSAYREIVIPEDLIQKCVKCGICKSVCPSYHGEEGSFARGRLALAEMVVRGDLPLTEEIARQWDECAMCRRCEWICPNDVRYKEILVAARALQRKKVGKDLLSRMGLRSLEFMQSGVGRKVVRLTGLLTAPLPSELKIPLPTGGVKFFPKPHRRSFTLRGKTFPAQEEKGRLLFFTGCMIDIFHGETGESVVKLMNRLGYTVVVPQDIRCCGAPHLYHGNLDAFEKLREHNLRELENYEFDALVVACPTCGGALLEDYDRRWEVYDFTQLIAREGSGLKFRAKEEESITFHVPCHSYTAMRVNPETFYGVMERVENVRVVRAELAQSCCGFAGLWSIQHPKLSERVQREKMEDFGRTGADRILTACPGCALQIKDGVRKFGSDQGVTHLADYLAERLEDD